MPKLNKILIPGFLLFMITAFINICVSGQTINKAVIKGVIKDSTSKAGISYGTIGLYKKDNTDKPIKNVITNGKGEYVFNQVDTGAYVIIITTSGYTEHTINDINVTGTSSNIDAGTVLLIPAPKDLQAVTVTSVKRPLIEKSEDKIIFNAEADPTIDGQQATDVLRKTPFLSVDNDGNVTLNGQTNFKILLNGKESSMFAKNPAEVLKSFPASLIKKIEVITQPSAKYDAEGAGGIINIITKKKIIGYNGSIGTYANTVGNRNINGNFNAKYGGFGLSGYAGIGGANNQPGNTESVTNNPDPMGAYKQRLLYGGAFRSFQWVNLNLELSYDIDSLHTISSYYNAGGGNSKRDYDQTSYTISPMNDTAKGIFNTLTKSVYPWTDWGVDFIKKFKGVEDKELTFKFNEEIDRNTDNVSSQQIDPNSQRYVLSNNKSNNYQYTIQTDFVLPLKNKKKIEMGAKAVLRRADADYESMYSYTPGGKYIQDSANTNIFNYDQNIYATYATFGFNVKKFFFKLGARGEWSNLGGYFQGGKSTVQQHYFNLVPTMFISRSLKNNQSLTLSYNIRLQRPYITDLNPFVDNSDSLNIRFGNPNLKPQIIHNLEFGYSHFKGPNSINLKLSGYYCNNKITQYALFDPATGITDWTMANIGQNYGTSLSGFVSVKPVKWWTFNSNLGLRYDFIINKLNSSVSNQGLSGWGNMNSTFDINNIFATSFNIGMWQGAVSLQQKPGLNYWYGAGAVLKLLKNKLRLSLRVDNFLNDQIMTKTITTGTNFTGYQKNYTPGRSFGLALRWNFGKLTDNVSKKRGVSTDDLKK